MRQNYTFDFVGPFPQTVTISGTGIIASLLNAPTFNVTGPALEFTNSSTAGPAMRVGSQAKVMVYPDKNLVMNALGYVRMRLAALLAYVQ